MLKRVVILLFVLAAVSLVSGCRETAQTGAATQATAPPAPTPATGAAPQASARPTAADQEELIVTLTLPPRGEKIPTEAVSGHGANCPQSAVSALLGVEITSPHGVVIGKVLAEGLAAKAGIKPGDSITKVNGQAITCPMTFMPHLQRSDKALELKLTIVRPKAAPAAAAPTKPEAE